MATDRRGRPGERRTPDRADRPVDPEASRTGNRQHRAGTAVAPAARTKIPLPPLPPPRMAAPRAVPPASAVVQAAPRPLPSAAGRRGLSDEESDLLGGAPGHEERTGAPGVTILSELVDEIQRGLDTEITRHAVAAPPAPYRQTVACSLFVAPDGAPENPPREISSTDRRQE